jgi:hypothetical protein
MRIKLKALGLGLAAAALSAVVATSAPATQGGHFVTDLTHVDLHAFHDFGHGLHFLQHGTEKKVGCNETTHTSVLKSDTKTVEELTFTPKYNQCYTTGDGNPGSVTIDVNGCTYLFTVAKNTTNATEQTARLQCPSGAVLKITHPSCTVSVPPQNINTGITYTKAVNVKNYITMDINAEFSTFVHGLCQFILPTAGTATLIGAARVKAINPAKPLEERNIEAT